MAHGVIYAVLSASLLGPLLTSVERIESTGEGNAARQAIYLCVGLVAVLCARLCKPSSPIFVVPISVTFTLAWFWVTLLWAEAPMVGLRRLSLTTLIVILVFMAVPMLTAREAVSVMKKVLAGVLLLNFLAVILVPSVGIHVSAEVSQIGMDPALIGAWKGILGHKNFAGPVAALTAIVFVLDPWPSLLSFRVAVFVASLVFMYFTGSKTSAGFVVVALLCGFLFKAYSLRYRAFVILSALSLVFAVVATTLLEADAIVDAISRPEAFTGRGAIWSALLRYWRDHPFGSGYGSFWNVGAVKPIAHYVQAKSWVADMAVGHNGYLDLLVHTGVVGVTLAVASLIVLPLGKLLVKGVGIQREGALFAAIVIFCAGDNLMESSLFERDAIIQVFLLFAVALIQKSTQRASSRIPPLGASSYGQVFSRAVAIYPRRSEIG